MFSVFAVLIFFPSSSSSSYLVIEQKTSSRHKRMFFIFLKFCKKIHEENSRSATDNLWGVSSIGFPLRRLAMKSHFPFCVSCWLSFDRLDTHDDFLFARTPESIAKPSHDSMTKLWNVIFCVSVFPLPRADTASAEVGKISFLKQFSLRSFASSCCVLCERDERKIVVSCEFSDSPRVFH